MRLGIGAIMAPGDFPINVAMAERGIGVGPRLPEVDGMDGYAAALGSLPLMRQPGEYWLYDTGMDLLGVLIERAAGAAAGGRSWRSGCSRRSGWRTPGFSVPAAKLERLAACYWRNPASGEFERFDGEGEESRFATAAALRLGLGRAGLDGGRLSRLRADDAGRAEAIAGGGSSRRPRSGRCRPTAFRPR